jgi:hypothetical protein
MPPSTPDVHTDGDLTVIEAPTAEAALGEVATRVGPHAQIVSVEKVLRGGLGGFFAREVVQIKARRAATAPTAVTADPGASAPPASNALQRVLTRLSEETGNEERNFAEALREQMGVEPRESVRPRDLEPRPAVDVVADEQAPADGAPSAGRVATKTRAEDDARATVLRTLAAHRAQAEQAAPEQAAPQAVAPEPAAAEPTAPEPAVAARPTAGASPVEWSVENLRRRGLPSVVIDAVADLDPRDDLAWVHAIGRAVATLCRPLPAGDAVLAGPKARGLAEALEAPCVRPPTGRSRKTDLPRVPRKGSFCAPLSHTENNRSWIGWARGDRWLHVVIGGSGWRDLLFDDPLAVSWVDDESLPEAIALCADLGLVLGYGGERYARACPVDIAMAIRAMMPRS